MPRDAAPRLDEIPPAPFVEGGAGRTTGRERPSGRNLAAQRDEDCPQLCRLCRFSGVSAIPTGLEDGDHVFVSGWFYQDATFGTGGGDQVELSSMGEADIVLLRFDRDRETDETGR